MTSFSMMMRWEKRNQSIFLELFYLLVYAVVAVLSSVPKGKR